MQALYFGDRDPETGEIIEVICTGVPRDRDYSFGSPWRGDKIAAAESAPVNDAATPATPEPPVEPDASAPVERRRIVVQLAPPIPERDDPGQVEYGVLEITGDVMRVEDSDGRPMGGHLLQAGDDADAIARDLLRAKKKREEFWSGSVHRPRWLV